MMERVKRVLIIIMFCAAMLFLLTFPSCRTKEYVTVHTTDTLYVAKIERDSVYLKDSTYIYSKNDTVYSTKYIDRFHYKYVHDTLYKSVTDTLIVQKEIGKVLEVEVEKHTPVKNAFAWIGFLTSVVLLGYILYRFKK